ncbi:MAG: class I SAM-dependent methyltransferase [Chlamydiota bacterium]
MYQLLDSGDGQKLEAFGEKVVQRPSPYALWRPQKPSLWGKADLVFTREKGWKGPKEPWEICLDPCTFLVAPTDFGHLGLFPEHATLWKELSFAKGDAILNLFGYTGAFSMYAAKEGASVTHVDASKPAVQWAKKNAEKNGLTTLRWIVEDVIKFLKKEVRRNKRYRGIILDPPSFGRGAKGEVFQIEKHLSPLFSLCLELLVKKEGFLLASCHTPGYTPLIFSQVLSQLSVRVEKTRELFLGEAPNFQIPAGVAVLCAT